ncbi:MAG: SH3 domain-containing protein [Cyanobacteria bacterium SZAS LIN-3]|nr:SH3 domain-containing protein [Cyanobacteria bacterium SZAS LIN-3]MBS2011160.1 SH3 domain-containing protein [Cyanobacteria bacterium SZAS TMP-1]
MKLPGKSRSTRELDIDAIDSVTPSPAASPAPSARAASGPSPVGANPAPVPIVSPRQSQPNLESLTTGSNRAVSPVDTAAISGGRPVVNPEVVTTGTNRAVGAPDLFADMDPVIESRRSRAKGFAAKVPKKFIVGGLGAVAVVGVIVAACNILPAMFDAEGNLQKIAKRVAAGPKNGSDAEHIKAELESTTKDFLEKNAKLTTPELTEKLQKIFPNSVFEIRVFDLPHDLRLVEVDTMITATDYLMTSKHAAVMRNFEVYDAAKVVSDDTGSNIALLGHRNAQAGHKPQVRVYALLPDGVADRTQETVPALSGDGNAVFASNGKDINLDLSLMSKASEERLFTIETLAKGTVPDETVKSRLTYKNGKYELTEDLGKGPMACLRAVAFVLTDGSAKDRFRRYFGDGTMGSIASVGKLKVNPPLFTLKKVGGGAVVAAAPVNTASSNNSSSDDDSRRSRRHRRHRRHHHNDDGGSSQSSSSNSGSSSRSGGGTLTYVLNNAQDAFEVSLSRGDGRYFVSNIRRVKASTEGSDVVVAAPQPQDTVLKAADEVLKDKVVVKDADLKKLTESNAADKVAADKEQRDKAKLAVTPPSPDGSGDTESHKQITPKVVEKKADAESGTISSALTTPTIKVRRGASTGYRSVGELKRGQEVQIIGKKDGWYKVQLDGREGYVYGGFVDCKTQDAYTTATVRRGKAVRDSRGSTIGEAQSGDRLVVIGPVTNDKYKVQLSSGRTGYLDKDAIDVTADAPQFVP